MSAERLLWCPHCERFLIHVIYLNWWQCYWCGNLNWQVSEVRHA